MAFFSLSKSISPHEDRLSAVEYAIGLVPSLVHDAISTPFDGVSYTVLKQRMQITGDTDVFLACRRLVREEGAAALVRSIPVTMVGAR